MIPGPDCGGGGGGSGAYQGLGAVDPGGALGRVGPKTRSAIRPRKHLKTFKKWHASADAVDASHPR